jgi:hypothetical protein
MADPDRFARLGLEVAFVTDEQLAVLESLSDEDLTLLADVKRRLEEAGGDVEAHGIEGGALLW